MGLIRFQHYLKDNKKSEYPYHFIFFDTETYQQEIDRDTYEHTLKLGVAIYWRRGSDGHKEQIYIHPFYTCEDFWDFVISKCTSRRKIVVISHNLPFDMGIVKGWKFLDSMGFKPSKIILDYNCNIWRFRKDSVSLLFLDNMNYFQTSLEALGDTIGFKKLPMPSPGADIEEWKRYCLRDAQILLEVWKRWLRFLNHFDLGSFGYTLASQAFNAFRHRFMRTPISIHTSNKAVNLERAAYRGGRNECFRLGEYKANRFYLLDINSMYPFVMYKFEYPRNLISTGNSLEINQARKLLEKYCLIAECAISTDEPCYGVKLKDKLVFPIGEFTSVLTTNEVLRGLERGYIKSIGNYALYERALLFGDYVKFFYSRRLEFEGKGMFPYAYQCKIMLNSLYGKFGQRTEEWKYVCDDATRDYDWWQEYDYQDKKVYTYRCINHRVEVSTGYHEGFNSLVAIAAEVTANARLYLWDLISLAGVNNVFYCDTDSLIVTEAGMAYLSGFIHPTELGKLKIVASADNISIHNLKDYSFGGLVKIKGVRRDAEMIEYNKYKQLQSIGIKSGLHNRDINRVIWRAVIKELKRDYTKGEVLPDGRVKPFVFSPGISA